MAEVFDRTQYQRHIPLENGCFLLQAVDEQGGDYDVFVPPSQYVGSRATETLARAHAHAMGERLDPVPLEGKGNATVVTKVSD